MLTDKKTFLLSLLELDTGQAFCFSCQREVALNEGGFLCKCGSFAPAEKVTNLPADWVVKQQKDDHANQLKDMVDLLIEKDRGSEALKLSRIITEYQRTSSVVLPYNKVEALRLLQKVENNAVLSTNPKVMKMGSQIALLRHQLLKRWDV